ncbi:MAG: leucine-rich repeat protein [Prevotellaceae bacterium]|jgi:uncharacterized protein (TIGR02145 family)|nr:leucine-rich repeat protein [Prevotellaceae bacterium]
MTRIFIISALVAGIACYSCKENEPLSTVGHVEGTVTDFNTHKVLSDVTVDIVSKDNTAFAKQSRQTSEDGKFTFTDLEVDKYNVSFSKRNYGSNSKDVDVLAGQTVSCDAALVGNPAFTVENGVLTAYHGKSGEVIIPDNWGITAIGARVFYENQQLTSVVIPEGVTFIKEYAFYSCRNLTTVTLPNSLTIISDYAFCFCSLTAAAITLPANLTSIGRSTFNSNRLKYITIPASVTSIGEGAFYNNPLSNIIVAWTTPPLIGSVFFSLSGPGFTLQVPVGTKAAYEATDGWKFSNIVEYVNDGRNTSNSYANLTIGGITWAAFNVDAYQTFAARPDIYTKFYQWSKATAWAATGDVSGWSGYSYSSSTSSTTWTVNPCPSGWRLPTRAEFEALHNTGTSWVYASARGNDVEGRFYGPNHATCTMNNLNGCVFLPACGYRSASFGYLWSQDEVGYYYSSTESDRNDSAYTLRFTSDDSNPANNINKWEGFSIRCVK